MTLRSALVALAVLASPLACRAGDLDPIIARMIDAGRGDEPVTCIVIARPRPVDDEDLARHLAGETVHPANIGVLHQTLVARTSTAALRAHLGRLTRPHPGILELDEVVWTVNGVAVRAPAKVVATLASRADVECVIADRSMPLLDPPPARMAAPRAAGSWGIGHVGADRAWQQYGAQGQGALVGHVDTGADGNHADLRGKIIAFRDFTKITAPRVDPFDDEGHGTHTAGTIVGGSASGGPIGIAPRARLIVAKGLTKDGAGGLVGLVRALAWIGNPDGSTATRDQPLAVSCSWGAAIRVPGVSRLFWLSISGLRVAGVVPVFASGNEGQGKLDVPGAYPHALAVGSIDERNAVSDFTSRGTVRWGLTTYMKPEISAPGESVYSALPGGRFGHSDGTSMATPHVAGAIALVWSARPSLSPTAVEKIVLESARDLGAPGRDSVFGHGLLDLVRAVGRARGGPAGLPAVAIMPPRPVVSDLVLPDRP